MKVNGNHNEISSTQPLKQKTNSSVWEMNWNLLYFRGIKENGKIEFQPEEGQESSFRKEKQNKNKTKHWQVEKKKSEEELLKP